ncbi:MAG: KamA family radical SAM protein [Chloroflexota bacterium]
MKTSTIPKGQVKEKPSGLALALNEADEEPPSKVAAANRQRFFSHVSEQDWADWRWQFRNRITTVEELTKFISLSPREEVQLKLVTLKYPLAITPHYLSLINMDNPDDPIRKQAVPSFQEVALVGVGLQDPLGEVRDSVVPGLVHRYPDRVLMVLTDICPMFCRHCTRKREWHKGGWMRTPADVEAMIDYVRQHEAVRDVILSGGDPLTLSTERLEEVIVKLRAIEHVEIIRIGSRYPVVLPQRIDDELCAMLSKHGSIWLNTHFNHPNELSEESARACDRLLRSGVPVNNQTVLLKGVNDNVETQLELCHGLLKMKVRPYYLFQCDEVQGTEHFRTPVGTGIKIMEQMRGHTSGLAIPTFVVDLTDGGGKIPLQPNYVLMQAEDELILRNYEGHVFHYRNPAVTNGQAKCARRNGRGNGNSQLTLLSSPE